MDITGNNINVYHDGSGASVTVAALTLRETTGRTTTGVYMANGSWTETGLIWNNKQGYGGLQSSLLISFLLLVPTIRTDSRL